MNKTFRGALEYMPEGGETFNLDALRAIVRDTQGLPGDHLIFGVAEDGMEQLNGLVLKHDTRGTIEVTVQDQPGCIAYGDDVDPYAAKEFVPDHIYRYRVGSNEWVSFTRYAGIPARKINALPAVAAAFAIRDHFKLSDSIHVNVEEDRT